MVFVVAWEANILVSMVFIVDDETRTSAFPAVVLFL